MNVTKRERYEFALRFVKQSIKQGHLPGEALARAADWYGLSPGQVVKLRKELS